MNRRGLVFIVLTAVSMTLIWSQSIVNSVHNLSTEGPGEIKSVNESQVCVFCHTPHNTNPKSPSWNRKDPGLNYILYNRDVSSTMEAWPGQPDGSSILCLSCHDGTIALGNDFSGRMNISFARGITTLPKGKTNLGKDLSDDHPISFFYNSALAASDPQLKEPSNLIGQVNLENGKVQCTSCHDPHINASTDFLVETSEMSVLCLSCHQTNYWSSSSHSTSTAIWNGQGQNPWTHTPSSYNTVARNACENCHNPHNANGRARLMNHFAEEDNCLICHNGSVANPDNNIQAQLAKPYKHDVSAYTNIHDPVERNLVDSRHVECSDCHNPHASREMQSTAPNIPGGLIGVKGINSSGSDVFPAQYEYEVCFRCHSSSPTGAPATQRQIVQSDTRLEFAPNSISFHPVVARGQNPDVKSLISPMNASSLIYCSDCHSSNGPNAPAGPHGSIYPQILKANYSKAEHMAESSASYALCYQCHSRNEFISNAGDGVRTTVHYKHVVEVKTSCNTCHDPHGISNTQGTSSRNSHLINFNTAVVGAVKGQLYFSDSGSRSGSCTLRCHDHTHTAASY